MDDDDLDAIARRVVEQAGVVSPSLGRGELDGMRCGEVHADGEVCGHTGPLFFHGRCHPNDATWASYADGLLTITCALCKRQIAVIRVAG